MNPDMENHIIINSDKDLKIFSKYMVSNVLDFKNGKELIYFFDDSSILSGDKENFKILNISIPISAAVTASARIYMSQFKTMEDVVLFYSDTDSIDIDSKLDPKYVGPELGKMKLEHVFDKAVFLAPK